MSLAKDILRLVNERDRLRVDIEGLQRMYDDLSEYCAAQDPDFINNWRRWSDAKIVNTKMWDYGALMGRAQVGPPKDFKFETNVPKIELEEENDD